jgi:hypothetical protein
MTHPRGTSAAAGMLRRGAVLTALAAVLFPRLNAVLHEHQAFWQLDTEAAVLIPAIIAATVALFALVGRWAVHHHGAANRSAKAGLTCAILALVGVVAFFVSTPIIVGGLALTLGLEGKQRAALNGKRRHAIAAIALGALAVLAGAGIWLAGP